ncbi:MAG: response regulator [Terasakiella sp.]|uniref:response regulator n=1 Tax=unclassified Terasakiella TaxID=2614952 RepID=UPI003AFF8FD1
MTHTFSLKALIVDDEDLVRNAVAMVLRRNQFEATAVPSGEKGLEACKENAFDIILTDLFMPQMDGVEFIQALRADGITTPIITFTGGARVGHQNLSNEAMKAGACLTLRKPVNKQQLLDAITTALELSR